MLSSHHDQGRSLLTRLRRAVLPSLLAGGLLALFGCSEKRPYKVAGVDLPNLADSPGVVQTSPPTREGVAETLTFNPAKLAHYEEYAEWLSKNGWSRLGENQEVSALRSVYSKDKTQLIMSFSPSSGLSISGMRPGGPTPSPAAQ